ncbi:hypothetical protein A3K02_02525 [candidate division WS6 bacterium RIFOXYD1_FULL_33_8]|uniref:Uncharacterized protein n=2 Tax=Candidatus Dojkabacteria TaxID=74243 RepID=A0A0G0AEK0_9BACT|nr:MAG: hypothetical protein UR32_C0027G0006 [candidate division WS6 bacterium GW2011_GWE2_33_157]KKP43806.1 MAG: hypothetical protein UR34_C0011G0060 [candidate division WS6 bacterium GW2011_GWC1_33_20]KKP44854.1 MAG: hypothetical protein UR36_C0013G0022 [candidate division WS6 bacterium GW2011_GWF1_33_233]KKP55028.1 MAG: hypothetical protein UR47_C0006G0021 [candidate division WS6 bacterium GW2011_GWB1_33_6]KKP81971.1 MAG: hypothetical protein UR84_C0011G0020 [candidate division WS6 bacterium
MEETPNLSQPTGLGSLKEETVTVEQTPIAEPKKKNNKFIITVLILIILILAGTAYLFFTNRLDIGIENPLNQETESVVEEENE